MTTPLLTTAGLRSLGLFTGSPQQWLQTLTWHLFVNNHTPAVTDTLAGLTEATFAGYAAVYGITWGAPTLDANNNYKLSAADIVWTATGTTPANTVYGYYATDLSGVLVLEEDNGAPFVVSAVGAQYTLSPRFYLGQILPPL